MRRPAARERGQALPLALALALLLLLGAVALFALGRVQLASARAQTAADLGAVSAARELRGRLGEVALAGPAAAASWRRRLAAVADAAARPAGARVEGLALPGGSWPPTAVEVTVSVPGPRDARVRAIARAGLVVSAVAGDGRTGWATGGGYSGPLVYRDGKPMCPAVGAAFDLMDAAASAEGVDLVVVSGFRSDAEQAVLFARHPDPKWVAPARPQPPPRRHRARPQHAQRRGRRLRVAVAQRVPLRLRAALLLGALALGVPPRLRRRCGPTALLGLGRSSGGRPSAGGLPGWVPARYRGPIAAAALANGVAPALLAALLRSESGFDPRAVSPAGAQGIAQLMPATARGLGVRDPFDPSQAIPAAARLLGGHLRAFGSVPLALAAYNAGPGAVRRYGGVPPYRETQAYVARVMALAGGAGALGAGAGGDVVLLRAGDRFV